MVFLGQGVVLEGEFDAAFVVLVAFGDVEVELVFEFEETLLVVLDFALVDAGLDD